MSLEELEERVAAAIANAGENDHIRWDECDAMFREEYRMEARAAISEVTAYLMEEFLKDTIKPKEPK